MLQTDKTYAQAVYSVKSMELTSKYQNLVQKWLQLGPGDWPNFIKNIWVVLKESKMKTKDEGEKGINILPTQLDNSTQDTSLDKNTEWNNEKLPTDCTWTPKENSPDYIKNLQLNKLTTKNKNKIKLNTEQIRETQSNGHNWPKIRNQPTNQKLLKDNIDSNWSTMGQKKYSGIVVDWK